MRSDSRRSWLVPGAAAILMMMVQLSGAAPSWNGQVLDEGGIPMIVNPAEAPSEEKVVEAAENWRLGGENEDDPVMGLISDVQVDEEGNAYLLDSHLSQILVMSPEGELLRTIGREGEGPGEFRRSNEFALLPDRQVAVMEMMPGQIVVLQRDGTPGANIHPEGFEGNMKHFQRLAGDEYGVVVGGVTTSFGDEGATIIRRLGRYDLAGKLVVDLMVDKEKQSGTSISLGGGGNNFTSSWALFPDGRVAIFGLEHEYRIDIYGRDGQLEEIVTRQYESLRRTDEDMAAERKEMEEMFKRFSGVDQPEIEPLERDITRVIPRPGGEFWVASSRGLRNCPHGSLGTYDVLNRKGHHVSMLRIIADYDSERDTYFIRNNRLFIMKEGQKISTSSSFSGGGGMTIAFVGSGGGDEEDDEEARPFEVICYELPD